MHTRGRASHIYIYYAFSPMPLIIVDNSSGKWHELPCKIGLTCAREIARKTEFYAAVIVHDDSSFFFFFVIARVKGLARSPSSFLSLFPTRKKGSKLILSQVFLPLLPMLQRMYIVAAFSVWYSLKEAKCIHPQSYGETDEVRFSHPSLSRERERDFTLTRTCYTADAHGYIYT